MMFSLQRESICLDYKEVKGSGIVVVTIEKYSPIREEEASLLSVLSDQAQFMVNNVPQVVKDLKSLNITIYYFEGKAVGFFLLDLNYSEKYQFGQQQGDRRKSFAG